MYIPNAYRYEDQDELLAFMRAHSFATLVSVLDGSPFASHVPLVVQTDGAHVTLSGHLARANPHWQAFDHGETLAIFSGPHAFVSPSLYDRRESVPTWNYIAVHAYGTPRMVTFADGRDTMERMLDAMIASFDPPYKAQWDELSDKFRDGMMNGIVAFEMPVTRLEGKAKLSQNRPHADQQRVAAALLRSDDPAAQATGAAMQRNLDNAAGMDM
jgi:transcriptional regulator